MTITAADLEKKYVAWFVGMKNTGQAKQEVLELFSTEPDDEHILVGAGYFRTVEEDHYQVE